MDTKTYRKSVKPKKLRVECSMPSYVSDESNLQGSHNLTDQGYITTVDAREHLAEVINRTAYGKERIILLRRGKKLLALVPMEDLRLIELAEDLIDIKDAKEALKEYENGQVIPLKEIEKRLSKVREV